MQPVRTELRTLASKLQTDDDSQLVVMTKTKVLCSFFSACLLFLVLGVGPAMGQEELKEANELNQQVEKLYQAGKYAEAIPLAQRILAIREKALGPEHPDVALSLSNLALLYGTTGQYAKAEPLYQRSLAIYEKALGPAHPSVATSLNNLAELYRATGQYAKAEPLYQRSLAIWEKALGPEHPNVAASLINLAERYRTIGEYAKAEPLYQRALAIQEKVLGSDHPDVATALNNLGLLYQAVGEYTKSEPLLERALRIYEKAFGSYHRFVARTLTSLAVLYFTIGDYAKAEPLLQRALTINEKTLGLDHPDVAVHLNNLAELYALIGAYEKAEPLFLRALAIQEQALGSDHPDVASILNNLAGLYRAKGEDEKVEPLLKRALTIQEKALGPDHPIVAKSLNNLAVLYRDKEEYTKAEPLLQRALNIFEKALGPNHPSVAHSLNNLALLYVNMEQYTKAEPLMQRALAIREKALGPEHPSVGDSFLYLARLEAAQQHYKNASGFFNKSFTAQERQIQNIFSFTTEEQKLLLIQSLSGTYFSFLSLIHQHLREDQATVKVGLELVLRRKGIVFDAQSRAREALQNRLSEVARKEWDRLSAYRRELSQILLNKPKTMTPEQYKEKIASLQQQIEQSEQRLAKESALVAKELQQRKTTVAAISKTLPKNGVLVEFVKVRDFDFAAGKWKPSSRYLAFVLTGDGNVMLVDLGDADALEALAQRALTDIKTSLGTRGIEILKAPCGRSVDPRGIEILQAPCGRDAGRQSAQLLQELYARVWAPLDKALGRADKVVISPDGLLNLVPFAALVDSEGHSLLERYRLAYVSSGRELMGSAGETIQPNSDLLLVANPAFGKKVQSAGSAEASVRSRDFRGIFVPLPGTEREAKEIPPLVLGEKGRKHVLEGINATEHAVKNTRSPRILHLATHGFFLQDEEIDPCGETRGVTVMKKATSEENALCEKARGVTVVKNEKQAPPKRYENPLIRSGLAFAGANKASEITEGDDGILTALEITGMDLYGTELVVLSACDTGVGEIKTGEGVFGLRRAFALAGAKNLLMSLWPVGDEITANQMKAFYRNLQTLPPAEALRQAQLETIKELKAQYDGMAPPSLWAPFILQGAQALGQ
jgi:CHAT domain-containing protein